MSPAPRYKARVDHNQSEIIAALEAVGCTVVAIGLPVDLLVGYRKRNFLIEVKNPNTDYGKNDRGTDEQRKFFYEWRGQVMKVSTAEEAVTLVSQAYDGR